MSKFNDELTSTQITRHKDYYETTLEKCGVDLNKQEDTIVINKEQSLIVRDIEKYFQGEGRLHDFAHGLSLYVKNKDNFQKVLVSTLMIKTQDNGREIKIPQDSLFRIFLNVDSVQNYVIDIILDEITNAVSEDESDTIWLRNLLNALRYLSNIQDSKNLTTRLLDILDIANYPSQLEILNNLPEILPDSYFDQTATDLSKLLESNTNLTGAILDCLNALSINSEIRTDVQNYILENLLISCDPEVLPVLFEFLVTDCKPENIQNILIKCRNAIDNLLGAELTNKSVKALILYKLYSCATLPKNLYEGWINVITGIKTNTEHKPIDILILFVLYSTNTSRKKVVESVFKKRIKNRMFKNSLLDTLFQKYVITQYLNDYSNVIIELATCLLQQYTVDANIVDFGSQIIKLVFLHELTNRAQRQEVLHNLILLVGASKPKTVENVLDLLIDISKSNPSKLSEHILQLMSLLEKIDSLELPSVKQIFELLCVLTCGPNAQESACSLKDELHMLIRKQLSSSKKSIKLRGIVAAVTMVKYVTTTLQDQTSINLPDESIMSVSDIPQGPPQEGATLLELVRTCSLNSPEYTSIFYDQMSTMIVTSENLDKYFFSWMFETFTNEFQNIFVAEAIPEKLNDIPISSQFSLNQDDEIEVPIHINIAEFSILNKQPSILILAPLFRLLRLLHFQHENGDLSSIDALLGCGVLLPDLQELTNYDIDQVRQIADCVFHCINWFREIVSAFVTQKNKHLRTKVLTRLEHIIHLENVLKECLEIVPEHKLPISYACLKITPNIASLSPMKSPSPPRKRMKKNNEPTTSTQQNANVKKTAIKKLPKDLQITFREIDIDMVLLLKYRLKFDDDPIAQSTQNNPSNTQTQTTLTSTQFIFLMKDFIIKLKVLTKNTELGLSNLSVVNTNAVIADSIRLLPSINKSLESLSDHLTHYLLEETTGVEITLKEQVIPLKECFNLIFECYSLIFGWNGFLSNKHLPLLRDCLKALRGEQPSQLNSANKLIVEFALKLSQYANQCLYLPTAVYLIDTLQSLYKIYSNPEIQEYIVEICGNLLTVEWKTIRGGEDSGKTFMENLEVITKAFLEGMSVKKICSYIAKFQNDVPKLEDKNDRLEFLPSFKRSTYPILYKCICSALVDRIKVEVASLTNQQHLVLWKTIALSMQGLMTIAKVHETRNVLVYFLKKSLGILKVFLSQGIPILEIMLRSKPDEVTQIFKMMQTSTRFLHHLCCHSKLKKDTSLTAFVPQFRLTIETLIYRVKGALIANNCSDAFWMGNLKNKDIHGDDIETSQASTSSASEQNTEDAELLPEDDSDEDILAPENDNEDAESVVF